MDRMDIHIEMLSVDYEKLSGERTGESKGSICMRVQAARDIHIKRPKTRFTPHTVLTDIMIAQGCLRETGRTHLQLLEYGAEQVGPDAKESVTPLYDRRLALTNTHAQGRQAVFHISSAFHFIQQCCQDAGTGTTQWMS